VEAYYVKNSEGNADTIYLYQGDKYIGDAYDVESKRYNECRAEWTDKDKANYEFQNKEQKKFHKLIKNIKSELPKIGVMDTQTSSIIKEVTADVEIIETPVLEPIEPDFEFDMTGIEEFAKSIF
jgi:hypothetical protein